MRLGITGKFVLLATGLVFLSTALWGGWTWHRERALLEERLEQKGRILVSTMALPFINALLYEEIGVIEEGGLLDTFVADIMAQKDLSPVYAMVVDPTGRVLAHNQFGEYGRVYDDPLTRAALGSSGFLRQQTRFEGKAVWDLTYPLAIYGKHWGVLRVGVSLEPLQAALDRLVRDIAVFGTLFSLGALGIFALIGRGLAAPLLRLEHHMEAVGTEEPGPMTPSGRRDEIGDLEASFNRMIDRMAEAEAARESATRRLLENERLVAVGHLVAGVAHEINNPLAAIEGALFHVDRLSSDECGKYVGVTREGLERIRRVVSQLVDLSRSGELVAEPVPLADLHRSAVLFAKMALKKKGVHLVSTPAPPEAVVSLDRSKIHQVLLNLIVNAADAGGEGATIRLETGADADGAWFAVCDDGPGVPETDRERVFEPFYTTKAAGKGSGMGLAISRRIAEGHGGTLTLEPCPDTGARFLLWIPRNAPSPDPESISS